MAQLSTKLPWDLANTKWAAILNPLIAVPIVSGNLVEDIVLTATTPKVVNHLLSRQPIGWFTADNQANAVIWRVTWNTSTITLESSANTTINIWIF